MNQTGQSGQPAAEGEDQRHERAHERGWVARALLIAAGPLLGLGAFWAAALATGEALSADGAVMLGIFVLAAWYWITGAIPAFATGVLVMGLGALLIGFPAEEGRPFGADPGSSEVRSWTEFISPAAAPVVVLMLGGLILGHAAHETGFDRLLARVLLAPFAKSHASLLLGVLVVSGALSMWMSNTATAAMVVALISPACEALGTRSNLRKRLLLAVAVGANIGGVGTPIGTPPNAIAFGALKAAGIEITFLGWMAFGVPLAAAMLLAAWGLLLWIMPDRIDDKPDASPAALLDTPDAHRHTTRAGRWMMVTTGATFALTIALWVTGQWTGLPVAAAALVPLMVFTATGILTRRDINTLEWDTLLLIAGGLALGTGMESTGLAAWMVGGFDASTLPLPVAVLALAAVSMAMSTLMSNTAAANLLMPIAIGIAAGAISERQAAVAVALAAGLAMALPVSTPPNAIVHGVGGLRSTDFLRIGLSVGAIGLLGVLAVTLALA